MASFLIAGMLAEGASRIILDRVDYLAVAPVYDSILGVRLTPHAAGHDEWGFRNRLVPETADVVTIGDSQTYGISAPARLSWPAQLGKLTGRRVYNLALGGYGPVQYEELLRTRALRLHPAVVVVGLYYGNDLWDAYRTVYGLRYWMALRRSVLPAISDSVPVAPRRNVFGAPLRDWLARNSVVYRLISFTLIGSYARGGEFAVRNPGEGIVRFQLPWSGTHTGFTPLARLEALNLEDSTVNEGLRLSLDRLERIAAECRGAGVHLLVALIPTKERVFSPWLAGRGDLREQDAFRALLRNETEANRRVRERLDSLGVRYVDLEAPLRDAANRTAIYPTNEDGHPNGDGYAVIAHAVAHAIRDWLP
jgi:hypothetical protein